jgi:hypothetical protein
MVRTLGGGRCDRDDEDEQEHVSEPHHVLNAAARRR